jgi:hypothetical protein
VRSRRCLAAVSLALVALTAAPTAGADPLADHAPVLVHDSGERNPLASVAREGVAARAPRIYGRVAGPWLQYLLFYAQNAQDRGVFRTGRHAGDWEMVQVRLSGGRPVEAVYAQHSGAERCGWDDVTLDSGHPVVFVANGSHASYFVPGVRDRFWPDPNDEADGEGTMVRAPLVWITSRSPGWMRWPGRWGGARAGWVPGEEDSPRGPAFQPQGRWSDPDAWAGAARPCTRGRCARVGACDGAEMGVWGGGLVAVAAVGGWALWRVRRRRRAGRRSA